MKLLAMLIVPCSVETVSNYQWLARFQRGRHCHVSCQLERDLGTTIVGGCTRCLFHDMVPDLASKHVPHPGTLTNIVVAASLA